MSAGCWLIETPWLVRKLEISITAFSSACANAKYMLRDQSRRHHFAPAQRPVVEKTNERERIERRPEHIPLRNLGWQEAVDLGEALFAGNSNAKFP